MVQLTHPYMATEKAISLTTWAFVSKVMSLLFNMLSRFVIAFLPRSKCLLVSWLQSPTTVILERKKIKPATVSIVSPSICHEVMRARCHSLSFFNVELSQLFHAPLSPSSTGSLDLKLVLTMSPGNPRESRFPSRFEGTLTWLVNAYN